MPQPVDFEDVSLKNPPTAVKCARFSLDFWRLQAALCVLAEHWPRMRLPETFDLGDQRRELDHDKRFQLCPDVVLPMYAKDAGQNPYRPTNHNIVRQRQMAHGR